MKRLLLSLVLGLTLLTGCSSLIPKRVELGQDKVEKVPVAKSAEREVQRQAAQRAALKTQETLRAALATQAEVAVLAPAEEGVVLTKAVSTSLGPPLNPAGADLSSDLLARKLDTAVAKLNARVDDFRDDNDKNVGHKIEGTGFLQVPYLVWAGGAVIIGIILFVVAGVGWSFLKMYSLSNPPVALGLKAVQTGGALASKAVGQLIAGGKKFEERVTSDLSHLSDDARNEIIQLFRESHKQESDRDVRNVVDSLTQK